MSIYQRPMQARDVRGCVEIASASPVMRLRYGRALSLLDTTWRQLLRRPGYTTACVWEEVDGSRVHLLGCGLSIFVSDNFMNELMRPPFRWFGPELVMRILREDRSLLSDKEIAEANSTDGLNLVVWDACVGSEDLKRPRVWYAIMSSFIDNHRGFFLRQLIAQANSVEHLQQMMESGGRLRHPKEGSHGKILGEKTDDLIRQPHVIVMDREFAFQRPGSWMASLFFQDPPRVGFTRGEQSLLLVALRGRADEELAGELGVSRSAVKKTWHSIYERVAACDSNLLPFACLDNDNGGARGKQKRHHLLSYLRDHPEELRPISRRLLRTAVRNG